MKMNIHQFYKPFNIYFRTRRMKAFAALFGINDKMKIVDVGGYEFNWTLIDAAPSVVLVNVEDENWQKGRFQKVQGDGRSLMYPDNSFDIAYSNSVIEHVGGFEDQVAFAREIRRVAPSYYVQTPNKWFFVEPHLIAMFIHFFPFSIFRRLVSVFSLWGWVVRPTQAQTDDFLNSIRLLDRKEMKQLFPDATIIEEKFLGMTKSFIAVRQVGNTLATR